MAHFKKSIIRAPIHELNTYMYGVVQCCNDYKKQTVNEFDSLVQYFFLGLPDKRCYYQMASTQV